MLANRITTARVMLNVVMAILSVGDKKVRFLKDNFFDILIIFFMTAHRLNIAGLAQHANRTEGCFGVLHGWLLFHALKSEKGGQNRHRTTVRHRVRLFIRPFHDVVVARPVPAAFTL